MLTIRLQRAGKTNKSEFRIILAEKTAAAKKKFVEVLGHYNPRSKEFSVKQERIQYWVDEQHVELSATVHNLFVTNKLVDSKKVKAFTTPKKEQPATDAKPEPAIASPETTNTSEPESPEANSIPEPVSAVEETPAAS